MRGTMPNLALFALALAAAPAAALRSAPRVHSRVLSNSNGIRASPLMVATEEASTLPWMVGGQKFGPQAPAHAMEKPYTNTVKLNPVEAIKRDSGPPGSQLISPLREEMLMTEEISISHDAVVILKHHGSYQQQNREARGAAKAASYQFMLRLKMPNGEVPPDLYLELDKLADEHGQGDLRATTRQAFQLHGVLKKDLKHAIKTIANAGASTLGGCGDINRNVMTPAARLPTNPAYVYAKRYASAMAELFKPMSGSFSELWLDGEKVTTTEYWKKDLYDLSKEVSTPDDIDVVRQRDSGNGVISGHPVEPIYGTTYLPRKFKIGVTVPGDNSIDLLTNDLGYVVLLEADGQTLKGFNVFVGGGMGRTHNKESTFARAADALCFIPAAEALELAKAVIATQRDHGNREIRANARMKYLVHTLGVDKFRELVGSYMGHALQPSLPLPPWVEGIDWLGWHEQGDGNWFVGINVQQGRIIDTPEVLLLLLNSVRAVGLPEAASFSTRVTGCPNGCARPYMAELALVGQGPDQYQVWIGGSPVGTRVASVLMDKMKLSDLETIVEPLLAAWRDGRSSEAEAFGDFMERVGVDFLKTFSASYAPAAVSA
ncbi:hypothetical protein T492DRAFT_1002682 [Pavlovales sp. CCMP2436]|nr:hypothetical protein T492DRAFT_1002682 [Pavlovales sp. CCMP2436]